VGWASTNSRVFPTPASPVSSIASLRRLFAASIDAGQSSAAGLRLHVGPNGVLVWAETAQIDRPEPYASAVLTIPKKSAAPVDDQFIGPEELADTPVYASLEAAVSK
jgi:hypothetical protein